MSTPEAAYLALIAQGGKISLTDADKVYDQLKPIAPSFLIGEWTGGCFNTGHPGVLSLVDLKWAGKNFITEDNVEPIIIYGDDGARTWSEPHGKAIIREVKYRGIVSACMIYDIKPILDHFRYVDGNTIAGVMESSIWGPEAGDFHFHLIRKH